MGYIMALFGFVVVYGSRHGFGMYRVAHVCLR